jgi:nucleotide sugar dehydrogenase
MENEPRRTASIIGIGRLGICAALSLEAAGYDVVGVDINQDYVRAVNEKTLSSSEPGVTVALQRCQNFRATTQLDEALSHSDLIFIFVATPTGIGAKSYDHSSLSGVLYEINKRKVQDKHIVIGCTVLPGYTRHTGRFLLKDCRNTTLNYNPEFIAQGEIMDGFTNPDMVLIGAETGDAGRVLRDVYTAVCDNDPIVYEMSVESAEITKLSVNCFITTKIAFANMVSDIAKRTPGACDTDILNAVGSDTRIGGRCLRPGFGFGGPCFPRDNRALGNYAESVGVKPTIPRATDTSNIQHAENQVSELISDKEAERQRCIARGLNTPRVSFTFSDVAYKPGCAVAIIEESQKLKVAQQLTKKGYNIIIRDREDIIREVMKEYGDLFTYNIV